MTRKLLTLSDVPQIQYTCPCGGNAQVCRFALLCESCRHPCKKEAPSSGQNETDPQKKLRAMIDYAKFRRRNKYCFDCKFIKAVFIDVECTNPESKKKVPKGGK